MTWALLALLAGCGTSAFLHIRPQRVADDLMFYEGGGGNAVALFHGGQAFLVDTKMGDWAKRLWRSIEAPRNPEEVAHQVRRILLTHAHGDHVGGVALYPQAGAVLVHPRARARLLESKEPQWQTVRFVEVEERVDLELAGQDVQVRYLGVGHTDGDLVAYLPERQLILLGDLWLPGMEPLVDEGMGGDLVELARTLDRLLELDFEEVLPGHGGKGTRAQVEQTRNYLRSMLERVSQVLARGASENQAVREVTLDEFPPYESIPFAASRERNVRKMYQGLQRRTQAGGARP